MKGLEEAYRNKRVHHGLDPVLSFLASASDHLRSTELELSSLSALVADAHPALEFEEGEVLDELRPRIWRGLELLDEVLYKKNVRDI